MVKVKMFEHQDKVGLETAVNAFLATMLMSQLIDISFQNEGGGSPMHTKYYAWIIYQE